MTRNTSISRAVRYALLTSAVAGAGAVCAPAVAQEQRTAAAADDTLTVTVTGSRIRRVDQETASPVFVIDQNAIESTGATTLGELINRIPAIAGAPTNPQVNNGGGSGEANVELRGLGAQRTLVLLNGRRIGIQSNVQTTLTAPDINLIPVNMIERVEVLKEGAGAIYGSDAIAGVVNFITRREFEGAEVGLQFGRTFEEDGESKVASLLLGTSTDRLSVMVGGNYNQQDAVSANNRDFSRFALYLYGGVVSAVGSSRTPTGRIVIPGQSFDDDGNPVFEPGSLAELYQCGAVTLNQGSGTSLSDYRCYTGSDAYNYQPFNLLMTPQERGNLFTFVNYRFSDYVEGYAEAIYNHTASNFTIAPLPFDATQDDVVISANNIYNPFGIDFGGGSGLNPGMRSRLEALGTREGNFSTDSTIANLGVRGTIPRIDWEWDLTLGFGDMDQDRNITGYLFQPALRDALGPSFIADDGTPTCGTPTAPIPRCTPINIFNVTDPAQIAALQQIQSNYQADYRYRYRAYTLNLTGGLFDIPAGTVQAAFGAEYRDQEAEYTTDILTRAEPPLFLTCLLAQETCTGDSYAKYNVREVYGELFVPLLADLPAVEALNLTVGLRWSDYSLDTIGSSTNTAVKLEYRPISDVLLRASWAEVFRAPTLNDLSLAPTQDAPTFSDPCVGLTVDALNANPNLALACQGVPTDGSFSQTISQITGLFLGSPDLKPETGDVVNVGIVYDSSQIRGLSLSLDFWRYELEDLITALDPNYAISQCVATGSPDFCGLVFRFPAGTANAGEIQVFQEPIVNLGELKTDGFDFGIRYALRDTPYGAFDFSLDLTRINSYENTPAPGATPVEIAGTYDRQFGNYAKWRGLANIGWSNRGFDGLITVRYIDNLKIVDPDGSPGVQPDLEIGSMTYVDLTASYTFPTDTKVRLGIINVGDKQPPLFYQNNVINANTDVQTYDLLGRRYFISLTQTF